MRTVKKSQRHIGAVNIVNIGLSANHCDDIPATLKGLQYVLHASCSPCLTQSPDESWEGLS